MGSDERNAWYNLSCLLQTYTRYRLSTKENQWRNQALLWLEEGCGKPVTGVLCGRLARALSLYYLHEAIHTDKQVEQVYRNVSVGASLKQFT